MSNTTDELKKRKSSRGRQRIEIKKLEVESKRQVTFSKRRKGLFNKAKELSIICGVEVAVLTVSKSDRVYATDNVDAVLNRYLGESSDEKGLMLDQNEVDDKEEINGGFWSEQSIENLGLLELMEFGKALQELRKQAAARLEELRIQNSTRLWPWGVDEGEEEHKTELGHDGFMIEGNLSLDLNSNTVTPNFGHLGFD